MRVGFSATAERQLLEALRVLAAERPSAAVRLIERIEAALEQIRAFPDSGRRVPEFQASNYREVIIAPYRLFYRRHGAGMMVVAMWHEAQVPDEPGGG